jgi:hypothetical protein
MQQSAPGAAKAQGNPPILAWVELANDEGQRLAFRRILAGMGELIFSQRLSYHFYSGGLDVVLGFGLAGEQTLDKLVREARDSRRLTVGH